MKIKYDTLRQVRRLRRAGLAKTEAEVIMATISAMEIDNLCSKDEIAHMQAKTVEQILQREDRRLKAQERALDKRMELAEQQIARQIERDVAEIRSFKRWTITLIITIGIGLAGLILQVGGRFS